MGSIIIIIIIVIRRDECITVVVWMHRLQAGIEHAHWTTCTICFALHIIIIMHTRVCFYYLFTDWFYFFLLRRLLFGSRSSVRLPACLLQIHRRRIPINCEKSHMVGPLAHFMQSPSSRAHTFISYHLKIGMQTLGFILGCFAFLRLLRFVLHVPSHFASFHFISRTFVACTREHVWRFTEKPIY